MYFPGAKHDAESYPYPLRLRLRVYAPMPVEEACRVQHLTAASCPQPPRGSPERHLSVASMTAAQQWEPPGWVVERATAMAERQTQPSLEGGR